MNPFEAKFRKFTESLQKNYSGNHADHIQSKSGAVFKDKPFTDEYKTVYGIAGWGQTIAQVVTFATTAGLGVFALQHIIPAAWGLYVALPIAILFAAGVEAVKRSTLAIAAKHLLKYKSFGFAGIAAGLVMCVSIAAALYGAKELPGVFYPKPARTTDGATVATLTADIEAVQRDIQRVQATISVNPNWISETKTLPKLQKERAALVARRDQATKDAEGRADAAHAEAIADRAAKVDRMQTYSVAAAIIAEVVFLLCAGFSMYYLWRAFAESESESESATKDTKPDTATAPQVVPGATITQKTANVFPPPTYNGASITPTNERRPIGFDYANRNARAHTENVYTENVAPTNQRLCDHCGTAYVYGHARQRYCSESCRVAAWEGRTGRVLKKQKAAS
ncbi:MAG: hypothetical protein JNN28_12540 [Saprospiraceae bacterium]|nr:hypothetical protein [Saprospiraceae bacterium]